MEPSSLGAGNGRGQLGWGWVGAEFYPNANPVELLDNVVAVAAGDAHSLALRADGTVWAWGANDVGQLGDTSTNDRAYPALVVRNALGQPLQAKAIAAYGGGHHSLALAPDGSVWAWGWNEHGQLGDGSTTNRIVAVPTRWHPATRRSPQLRAVKAIAVGWQHSLALSAAGRAFGWGLNDVGQLGDGTTNGRLAPNATAPVQWITPPLDETGIQRILPLDAVTALVAGDRHSLALGGQPNV